MPIVVLKGSGKVQKKRKNEEDEPFHLRGMDEVLHMKVFKISQPHFFTGAVTTTLIGGDIFYKEEENEELALGLEQNKVRTTSSNGRAKKDSEPTVLQEIRAHKYRSRKKDVENGDFVRHVWEDGEKRKKISAGFSFHEYLEPSASPDECLAWAIRYVSTNDHNLVEAFLKLDERIQRFESGKLEGIKTMKSATAGGHATNGIAAQMGKAKDGVDADRSMRTAKKDISLAQQLELIKQQGTEAFLRAIQQTTNNSSSSMVPENAASGTLGNIPNDESIANSEKMKIANKPPSLQPRRPTDDKPKPNGAATSSRPLPKQSSIIPTRTASFRGTSPRPRLHAETSTIQSEEPATIIVEEPNLRGRGRLGSSDSVDSGSGSVADTASFSNEIINEDSEIPGDENLEDMGSNSRTEENNKSILSVKSSLRPPAGPPPSKAKQDTSNGMKGRKVRIADNASNSKEFSFQNDGEGDNSPNTPMTTTPIVAKDGHKQTANSQSTREMKEKSPKKRKTQQEAVKYGNHLRPAYALYDQNDTHAHVDGDGTTTNNKPNQFELMRREQQQLRRSIGAALQNFARANKKHDTVQQKTKTYIDKASKATKQLYAGFATFEAAREEGSNDATHLWEEKVQLRAGFLAAKMRFLSAADTPLLPPGSASANSQQQQLSPPSSARGRTSSSTRSQQPSDRSNIAPGGSSSNNNNNNNATNNNEEMNRLNQLMRENQQMNRKLMEDFGKPGGQIHKDMARMRLAAQRDIEHQELRALLSPNNRWFVTCVLKMREHLRRSSNSAPPCALKFIFVLQLLLKLQAAANERQRRKLKEKHIVPTAMDAYQPIEVKEIKTTVSSQVRKTGLLSDEHTHHIALSFSPKQSPSHSPSGSPKHRQSSLSIHSPLRSRSSSPNHFVRPASPARVESAALPCNKQLEPSSVLTIAQNDSSKVPPLNIINRNDNTRKSISSPKNRRSTSMTTSISSPQSQGNLESIGGMSSPNAETGDLESLNVTPRILSLLLLSPIFTKDDLRKALVQQLVEVVRDGVGWAAEPFARFLEKHELPVPAELLNLLRTMAKERTAKRDRERRETSLASSAGSPGAPPASSRTRQSLLQRSTDSPQPVSEIALVSESVPSTSRQMSTEDAVVSVEVEMPLATVAETHLPNERLEILTDVVTMKREALLADSEE